MWATALLGSLFFQFAIFQMTVFNSLSTHLISQLGLSNSQFGLIGSLYFYSAAAFLIPAGLWLDRGNIKKILCLVFGINLIALMGLFFIPSITTLSIYRILCGASNCFAFLSCMKILSQCFSGKQLGIANAVIIAFCMLGGVFESPFDRIVSAYGWHNSLLAVFIYGMLYYTLIIYLLNPKRIQNKPISSYSEPLNIRSSLAKVFSYPVNWQCGLYTGFLNLPVTLLAATWGSLYLIQVKHLTALQANSAISLIFIGMIVGAPLVGWVSANAISKKQTMIGGAILSLLFISIIMMLPPASFALLAITFALLGAVTSTQILSYPIVTESNSLALTGTVMSFVSILVYLIGAGLSGLFGLLATAHANSFDTAFILLPFAFLLALFCAIVLKSERADNTHYACKMMD